MKRHIAFLAAVLIAAAGVASASPDDGYLGVYMQDLTKNVRKGLDLTVDYGVLISRVEDDSPAAKAGIEKGDVIIKFDGKKIEDPDDLSDLVEDTEPGSEVEVVVIRDGKEKKFTVEVGEREDDMFFSFNSDDFGDFMHHGDVARFLPGPKLGVQTAELNDDLAGYFDTKEGVLVLDVMDESVASEAGLKSGDVIRKVNGEDIEDTSDIRRAIKDLDEGDQFEIQVVRKSKNQTLKATMDDQSQYWIMGGNTPRVRVHGKRMDIPRAPRMPRVDFDRESLRKEMDELRKEIQELKEELKKKDT